MILQLFFSASVSNLVFYFSTDQNFFLHLNSGPQFFQLGVLAWPGMYVCASGRCMQAQLHLSEWHAQAPSTCTNGALCISRGCLHARVKLHSHKRRRLEQKVVVLCAQVQTPSARTSGASHMAFPFLPWAGF